MFNFSSVNNTLNKPNIDLKNQEVLLENTFNNTFYSKKLFISLDLIEFLIDMGYLWIFPAQRAFKH